MASDATEHGRNVYPSLGLGNSFAFKFEDIKGRVHRLNCGECFQNLYKNLGIGCALMVE